MQQCQLAKPGNRTTLVMVCYPALGLKVGAMSWKGCLFAFTALPTIHSPTHRKHGLLWQWHKEHALALLWPSDVWRQVWVEDGVKVGPATGTAASKQGGEQASAKLLGGRRGLGRSILVIVNQLLAPCAYDPKTHCQRIASDS